MGRRIWQPSRCRQAPESHRARHHSLDWGIALFPFLVTGGYVAWSQRYAHGDGWRDLRAHPDWHIVQRIGGDWIHRSIRHLGYGRHHFALLLQPTFGDRKRKIRRSFGGLPDSFSPGDDDM